jgi:protein-S-isoprenylcysteine O-methyltransferase Ste14
VSSATIHEVLATIRLWAATWLALSLPPAIAYWLIVHPFIGFWRRMGKRATFWTIGIFYVGSIVALIPLRGWLRGRDLGWSLGLSLVALPLLVVSGIVARRRRKHLTFRILAGVPEVNPAGQGPGLLTEGIYARIRHPRYAEFILGIVGWALVLNYLGFYVMTAVSIALLFVIVHLEERELCERFGQAYVDYAARVPRFIPRSAS